MGRSCITGCTQLGRFSAAFAVRRELVFQDAANRTNGQKALDAAVAFEEGRPIEEVQQKQFLLQRGQPNLKQSRRDFFSSINCVRRMAICFDENIAASFTNRLQRNLHPSVKGADIRRQRRI